MEISPDVVMENATEQKNEEDAISVAGAGTTHKIANVSNYYQKVDDSAQVKSLDEANSFVRKEIEKLKKYIEEKERDISSLKKEIKKI